MGGYPGSQVFTIDGKIVPDYMRVYGATLRRHIEVRLGVTDRQARACVSSWSSEGWMERDERGGWRSVVTSVDNRCALQIDRRDEARRENGALGGRPVKSPGDDH